MQVQSRERKQIQIPDSLAVQDLTYLFLLPLYSAFPTPMLPHRSARPALRDNLASLLQVRRLPRVVTSGNANFLLSWSGVAHRGWVMPGDYCLATRANQARNPRPSTTIMNTEIYQSSRRYLFIGRMPGTLFCCVVSVLMESRRALRTPPSRP